MKNRVGCKGLKMNKKKSKEATEHQKRIWCVTVK